MTYTKLNLENGHILDATDMAHIEGGIYNNDSAIGAIEDEIGSEESSGTILNKIAKNANDITQVKSIGKYLSNWNMETGLPDTDPTTVPYTYHTGDYYIIGSIPESAAEYRPEGTVYDGTASTDLESEDVAVGDFYLFDGTNWILMVNVPKQVNAGAGITITNNSVSVNYGTGLEVTNGVLGVDDSTVQSKITAGDGIAITGNSVAVDYGSGLTIDTGKLKTSYTTETWTFTLENNTTVTKQVVIDDS